IPQVMVNAVIAAEDADFRSHEGLDYPGMIRAMLTNVQEGRLAQGASTITQQVARTFFLTREKTFSRKIREILLTKRIEERLTKDEILFLYLNQINFGRAHYGVGEAARYYFDKNISEITVAEAALLAGIPKGPAIYEPIGHPDAARERRVYVLGEMAAHGMITASEAELAKTAPLGIEDHRGPDRKLAPEVVSLALDELEGVVNMDDLRYGGDTIETSLDPALQRAARDAVRTGRVQLDGRHGWTGPYKRKKHRPKGERLTRGTPVPGKIYVCEVTGHDDGNGEIHVKLSRKQGVIDLAESARYNPDQAPPSKLAPKGTKLRVALLNEVVPGQPLDLRLETGPQAALAAIDPKTGAIVALIGGYDVRPAGFDRATSARRQPGSAFKPFVYLEAIRSRRYTPATVLDDAPEIQGDWRPKNSSGGELAGAISMREALARSLNLPAIKLIGDVGADQVASGAARVGIESELEAVSSLALGTSVVTPIELTGAYATLASGGVRYRPWVVKRVIGPDGREIPLVGRKGEQVLAAEEAYLITSLLESVVRAGTGRKARALGRPAAGKTGTTDDARDAWFVGYTPDLVATAWVGFDDMQPLGHKEYGGRAALPIWLDFMKRAHKDKLKRQFERPAGIVEARIDPASGLLAYEEMEGAIDEVFIEGTEPTETALPPDVVSLESFALEQAAAGFATPDAGSPAEPEHDAGDKP
ncbi:MAG: PBP1A family penicillin-binding protein, partial [Deltaproteobacteria bacterium]|nr:PBP1A family penicillin-binding protein [Deltaproteobacteria bacterium]